MNNIARIVSMVDADDVEEYLDFANRNPNRCDYCKQANMNVITNETCTHDGCGRIAGYGSPGECVTCCFTHKTENMVMDPRRIACENCGDIATHGLDDTVHCKRHAWLDEALVLRRVCPHCHAKGIICMLGQEEDD